MKWSDVGTDIYCSVFACVQIMMGFLLGYAFSAIITRDGQSFINYAAIKASPSWQFLWVSQCRCTKHPRLVSSSWHLTPILGGRVGQLKTFKLGFYPAAVLPLIIAFAVDAANTVGDITASEVRLHPRLPSLHFSNFGMSQRS